MENRVDITDLFKEIAERKKENEKLKLQQLNKSSETPSTSKNEEKQQPQDDSSPSTSKSTSEFNKTSTTTSTTDEISATTDNSETTYRKKAQHENYKNQFSEYKKRKGTDDQGKEYEYLMCAYYALKLCFDENVADFEITTNNEDYGDFDDVALKVTFLDNSSHHFLMQMKHTGQVKGITDKMLSTKSGDFSLIKYFKSFQKLQDRDSVICIVFTNRKSQLNDKSEFKLEDDNITVNHCQPHNINHLLIDTVSGDETAHIFSFKQNGKYSQNFENFFENFYLFTNQKGNSSMQSYIDKLLFERFGCKVDFIGFMRQWWKGRFVLNKHDVIVKLSELVLSPFVHEIPKNANESLSDKAKLLKEAIMQFEVTVVKDCDANKIAKIWMEESTDSEMIRKASLKYGLTANGFDHLTPREFTKVLWHLNIVPLIVKFDEKEEKRFQAAFELLAMKTNKKKLVLVGHKSKEALSKWTIFESLYDLRTAPLYKEIVAAFKVSLQGRQSIHLEKFINSDSEMTKHIKIKDLFLMLEKDLRIGKPLPKLPVPYIPRSLKHDYSVTCEDKAFSVFNNPVNIVTGKPGIGKSTLLTYLSHQCPPDYWCVRVNLIKHSEFFNKGHSTEEIMNRLLEDEDIFFATFRKHKRIYLLLDGLDEIDANCVETVLTFIKEVSSNGIRVWISSRKHLEDKVSNYFQISPITLEELTRDNQEKYIEKRLCHCDKSEEDEGVIYTEDEAKEIITRLFASVNVAYNCTNILGVPLLLFIITEIFRNDKSNFEKMIKEDIFVVTKMYKLFFQGKEEHQHRKAGVQYKGALGNRLDYQLRQYEVPALETSASEFLPKLKLDSKKLNKSQKFLEDIQDEGDPLGIISQVVEETNKLRAIFSHQSFAEYFACVWLKKNKEKLGLIKDSFFEDNNDNLRLIFDIMLAEDKPLHLAVLYKSPDQVEKYINHYGDRDEGGRTALHLTSSYSRNDSILRIDSNFEPIPKNVKIYELLLKNCNPFEKDELFKWNCFDYALSRYSLFLFEILLETNKERIDNIDIDTLIERFGINKFIGSCCLFGYFRLLKFMSLPSNSIIRMMEIQVEVVNLKLFKQTTALLLASANGNSKIIELLLKRGCDINEGNEDNDTPLHFACWFGTYKAVVKILESGADLNAVNNRKQAPLHLASLNGKTDIIELLSKKGCKINVTDEDNSTPLHYACRWGTCDTVLKILELGGDLNAVTNNKLTPLHLASANGKTDIIDLLSKKGCKINATDRFNSTPLHVACCFGTYEAVIKIFELGGDLNAVTRDKQTSLHLASVNGKTNIIELLSKKGCKINATDKDGLTPLHFACLYGKYDAVVKILELGGDLNAVTNKQETPLHLASANGKTEIVELLLKKGCAVNVTNENNLTPLDYAFRYRRQDVAIKILEYGG